MRLSIMAATLAAAVTSEGCALTEWLGLDDRFPQSEARGPAGPSRARASGNLSSVTLSSGVRPNPGPRARPPGKT